MLDVAFRPSRFVVLAGHCCPAVAFGENERPCLDEKINVLDDSCSTQLPTRTCQTCQKLPLHLPEHSTRLTRCFT